MIGERVDHASQKDDTVYRPRVRRATRWMSLTI
jgi:hypothetical protein